MKKLKKYIIFIYLLLWRYKFYGHFFYLVFIKLRNILTFYKINSIQLSQKKTSLNICNKKSVTNKFFFNFLKNEKKKEFNKYKLSINKLIYSIHKSKKLPKAANLELILSCCILAPNKSFLETGVAHGWSSLVFLHYLKKYKKKLTSIDMPYLDSFSKKKCGEVVPSEYRKNWDLLNMPDSKAIKIISRKKNLLFDLIHYDSDKSIEGREKSYNTLWKLLKPKGIFISDDIEDNMSFFYFCHKNNLKYHVVKYKNKFQGVVFKDRIK